MNYFCVYLSSHRAPGCHSYSYIRRRGWVHGWKSENIYWLPTYMLIHTYIQGWSKNWQINLSIKKDVRHWVDFVLQIIWQTLLILLQIREGIRWKKMFPFGHCRNYQTIDTITNILIHIIARKVTWFIWICLAPTGALKVILLILLQMDYKLICLQIIKFVWLQMD